MGQGVKPHALGLSAATLDTVRTTPDEQDEFEAAETPDAKFAKAVDRMQPILLNHVVGGGTWVDYDVDEARERRMTHRIEDGAPTLWAAAEHVFADAVANGWLLPAPSAL